MIIENLSTLKINKLTQEQYERELEAGRIDETALYLTPDDEADVGNYATVEQLDYKANIKHTHTINDIDNLQSLLDGLATKEYIDSNIGYIDEALNDIIEIQESLIGGNVL